jgi:calcium-dependent protein kinase
VIDYSEFITATINRDQMMSTEKLKQCFALFDTDSSGTISMDELVAVLGVSEDIGEFFQEADENLDGDINFEEFKSIMQKMLK